MTPWELLGKVTMPASGEVLTLHRRGEEYLIKVDGSLLMGNRAHASEDDLAVIGCAKIAQLAEPRILIGGLGMGYTLAATLKLVGPRAKVYVSELVPAVVEWNQGPLSHLAGHPLRDRRSVLVQEDVAQILRTRKNTYDAILQDVDNGPEGLTVQSNDWLYLDEGLAAAYESLRPKGVMAIWSAKPNKPFVKRMRKIGYEVEEHSVRGREGRGAHHIVWTAVRPR